MKLTDFKSRVGLCELKEVAHDPLKKAVAGMRGQASGAGAEYKRVIVPGNKPMQSGLSKAELEVIKARKALADKQHKERASKGAVVGESKWRKRGETALLGTLGATGSAAMLAGGDDGMESITARAGNLQEADKKPKKKEKENEVEMPKGEYKAEHVQLIKTLRKCKTAAAKQEAKKQSKEMKKELKKKD